MTDRESLIEQAPIQDRDLLQRMSLYFDAVDHRLRHGEGWLIFNASSRRARRIAGFIQHRLTEQVALTRDHWDAVNAASSLPPAASLLREVGRFAFSRLGRRQFPLHDPLSVAVAIDPTLIDTRQSAISVDTVEPERGRTRIVGPGTVHVATSVDSQRALDEFRRTVGLPTSRHGNVRIEVG